MQTGEADLRVGVDELEVEETGGLDVGKGRGEGLCEIRDGHVGDGL